MKFQVLSTGSDFTALYPARKLAKTSSAVEPYAAQAREPSADAVAKRVGKALGNDALRFVPLSTPEVIGTFLECTLSLVGHVTDETDASAPAKKKS